jgi:hypothetical protein
LSEMWHTAASETDPRASSRLFDPVPDEDVI